MTEPLPNGWAPSTDLLGPSWEALPTDVRAVAEQVAVRTLWALSGRRFGTLDVTLAPFIPRPRVDWYTGHRAGVALNAGSGMAVSGYCTPARAFRLPGPVVGVAQVVVDAEVLDDAAWHLDPDGTLVRTDGGGWPVAQDVYSPRWAVRYTRGIAPGVDGNLAAARYALELGRGMVADPKCKLPSRARDVTRQGVSVTLAAPEDLADAGYTGVPPVDAWLRTVNPDGLRQAASIWSPLSARHRVLAVHSGAEQ